MNEESFEVDDYYHLKYIEDLDVSPDGSQIAYVLKSFVSTKDEDFHHKERMNIWLYSIVDGSYRQITYGDTDLNPSWSPDGASIIFSSKRGEISQLYNLPMDGGEAKQITKFVQGVATKAQWSSDTRKILFSAGPAITPKQMKKDSNKPYRITRELYRLDATGLVDNFINDIYSYDFESDETKQLTDDTLHNTEPRWSPDNNKILYISSMAPDVTDAFFGTMKIIEDEKITEIIPEMYATTACWYDDAIVFIGQERKNSIILKQNVYIYDFDSLDNRTEDFRFGVGLFHDDLPSSIFDFAKIGIQSDHAYVNIQDGGKNVIYRIVLKGDENCTETVGGDRLNFIYNISGSQLIFVSSNPINPTDIYSYDLEAETERQLTKINQKFLSSKSLATMELLKFIGNDGVVVEGWLLKPNKGGKPYPTLLHIHGGPQAAWGYLFQIDAQLLCGQGYAVLLINPRGSTGYGDEFSSKIVGDWGNHDYGDLMAGIDYVIDLGLSDPDRLGCFGLSGGGNLSCWIVGNTDRFKAAIPQNPVTNFQSFYGVSDVGRAFCIHELGGLPHEIPEIYKKCSPITYAHNCKTPTLLIQHDMDYRCPPEQSEQFYAVLRDVGCEVEMLRMPGSSHGGDTIGPLVVRETQNRALIDWFKKYIDV